MSKINPKRAFAKDSFFVTPATIATGWIAGQLFKLNTTGDYAQLSTGNGNAVFVALDGPTELAAPPTGSIVTGMYGAGTRFVIDHTPEVIAGNANRAYESDVESAAVNSYLYGSANGKWTSTGGISSSGSVLGQLLQIPSASNNYRLEIKLLSL